MLLIIEILFIVLLSMILFMLARNETGLAKRTTPRAQVEGYWDEEKERRQCVRFKKDLEVCYVVEKKAHLKNNGKAVDISGGGLRLLIDEKLAEGTIVELQITLPGPKRIAEVEGEVVWSEEAKDCNDAAGKRLFHAGVRFLAVRGSSGKAIAGYVRPLCLDLGPQG